MFLRQCNVVFYMTGKNRGYLQDMPDDYIIPGMEVTKLNKHTRAFVRKRQLKNWRVSAGLNDFLTSTNGLLCYYQTEHEIGISCQERTFHGLTLIKGS